MPIGAFVVESCDCTNNLRKLLRISIVMVSPHKLVSTMIIKNLIHHGGTSCGAGTSPTHQQGEFVGHFPDRIQAGYAAAVGVDVVTFKLRDEVTAGLERFPCPHADRQLQRCQNKSERRFLNKILNLEATDLSRLVAKPQAAGRRT